MLHFGFLKARYHSDDDDGSWHSSLCESWPNVSCPNLALIHLSIQCLYFSPLLFAAFPWLLSWQRSQLDTPTDCEIKGYTRTGHQYSYDKNWWVQYSKRVLISIICWEFTLKVLLTFRIIWQGQLKRNVSIPCYQRSCVCHPACAGHCRMLCTARLAASFSSS